jgi:hypothetical protein
MDLFIQHPLPAPWPAPTIVEDAFEADGLTVRRAGLSTVSPSGEEILGSAAEIDDSPVRRAYFELLERVSTIQWLTHPKLECDLFARDETVRARAGWKEIVPDSASPSRYRFARSNGVALHEDWRRACDHAFWELCERDRVLRSWYGETVPEPLSNGFEGSPLARTHSYEWFAFGFPSPDTCSFSHGIEVIGVFGFPMKSAPLVFGYGARPSRSDALRLAVREAMQLLAFLWAEPVSTAEPALAPAPSYHLEMYQPRDRHRLLLAWLHGEHAKFAPPIERRATDEVLFANLTPSWLKGLRVAKAICAGSRSLIFGEDPMASHLPSDIRAHPIA